MQKILVLSMFVLLTSCFKDMPQEPVLDNELDPAADSYKEYSVVYNGNDSTGGFVPTDNSLYGPGNAVTMPDNGTLIKPGYTFAGWNTAADGSGANYLTGSVMLMAMSNVTLYAQWRLTVTYDGNTSDSGTPPVDSNFYLNSTNVTVLGNGTLAKTGHTFAGWNTAANGSGTAYASNSILTIGTSNIILYAQWSTIPYTITYDGTTFNSGTIPVDGSTYTIGQTITLSSGVSLTNTNGVILLLLSEWNTAADGSGTSYSKGSSLTVGSSNITLYAQWRLFGGTGPGGGIVFYDKGYYSNGWRYLEAAPKSTEFNGDWGIYGETITGADETAIGTGAQNTADIVAYYPAGNYTANMCNNLSYGGYNDWFLPSRDELNQIYQNLYQQGIGGFEGSLSYISSSEYLPNSDYYAWGHAFHMPSIGMNSNRKDSTRMARAVRYF